LVTGASGFIGSHFIEDYQNTYNITKFSLQNDSLENIDFSKLDAIFHCAALVHQMEGAPQDEYYAINLNYTINLAQKAKQNGVRHFIFMSSVKVYGEEQKEDQNCYKENSLCSPQDDYGQSKFDAENELIKLQDENFTVSIVRTPVVYGEGVKANIRNLTRLVQQVSIIPLGGIKNKRSMVYVKNLTAMVSKIIDLKAKGIFLASDAQPISTSELVRYIANGFEKKSIVIGIPLFGLMIKILKPAFYKRLFMNLCVDNRNTKEKLEFSEPYSTEEGILRMVRFFKNNL
jgi:UDP-glucose 4-epimerase